MRRSTTLGTAYVPSQDTEEELELDQPPSSKKKVGKWERRQRRIAAASKAGLEPAKEAATEEDFLELVEAQREGLESQAVLPIKKRLKIRKDGSAQVLVPVSAFRLFRLQKPALGLSQGERTARFLHRKERCKSQLRVSAATLSARSPVHACPSWGPSASGKTQVGRRTPCRGVRERCS